VRWSKSDILLGICLIFIGGLFVISVFEISPFWGFLFSPESKFKDYNDLDKEITFIGYITKEPDKRSNHQKLKIKSQKLKVGNQWQDVSDIILVTTRLYPEYQYGDELEITGKLKTPSEFEDFNYKGYLAKDRIHSVMYYPKIEPTGNNRGNFLYKTIYFFKNKIKQAVEEIMPLPEVAILEALILGNKQGLTDNLKNQLNISGTRHITAISGMHIIILIKALMIILISIGLWRGQAFYVTLGILALFIIMIGAPASAVRAGVMGGILLFAEKIGRLNDSGRAIVFAAAVMLALNPLLLKFDIGFQLSFLAVLGIIYIKPIFDEWLDKLLPEKPKRWLDKGEIRKEIPGVITMTFAAQIATLPILVYNFGQISFISPLANVLIVPALPYVMGTGFIFSLASVLWSLLGKILIWPVWFIFAYITKLVELFSKLPFAAKKISNVHWVFLVGYYVLLIGFLYWYKKQKNEVNLTKI